MFGANEELTLAILAALEQIGDGSALPHVEKVVRAFSKESQRPPSAGCREILSARSLKQRVSR